MRMQYSLKLRSNLLLFFFSSRRRHTRFDCDWSSDVCSSDLKIDDTIWRLSGPDSPAGSRVKVVRADAATDRKSTRLNSSHSQISYAVFCLEKKNSDVEAIAVHTRVRRSPMDDWTHSGNRHRH